MGRCFWVPRQGTRRFSRANHRPERIQVGQGERFPFPKREVAFSLNPCSRAFEIPRYLEVYPDMHFVIFFCSQSKSPNAYHLPLLSYTLLPRSNKILFANRQFSTVWRGLFHCSGRRSQVPLAVSVHLSNARRRLRQGNVLVGYHQLGINFDNPPKPLHLGQAPTEELKVKPMGSGTEFLPSMGERRPSWRSKQVAP